MRRATAARAPLLVATGLLAAALLAAGGTRAADGGARDGGVPDGGEEGPEKIAVAVGKTVDLRLGWVCIEWICDDKEIVRVEDGGDHLKLRGLKAGRTLCGFWREPHPKPQRLFEVTVTAAKPPAKR